MIDLYMYIGIICLSYILSNQIQPLEEFKVFLDGWFNERKISRKKWFKIVFRYTSHLFNCSSCISFWIILFVFSNLWLAFIGYVISAFISNRLNTISF